MKFFVFFIFRHSFSEAVGKNVANPTAMLLSAANMLEYTGLHHHRWGANQIREGIVSNQ